MRNLKRALSLTLASVMLLGMMAIGTSAASYPDVDENDNVEAIEVLQAVGVMQGDDKGNFDPDRSVSRNEMAIVMAKLLNLDYNYYSESCPFWDVPDYAKPYVGACYANGIVSGYNATTYGGADTVTAVQAASMMMRALGYFQYDSDYKDGFVIATVRQASRIGLFADINANQDTPLTRNQVAQLALNTLESTMVDAEDNTLNISGSSGDLSMSVTGGQVNYIVRTSNDTNVSRAIGKVEAGNTSTTGINGWTVELGEQLYSGDLRKDPATDDFQRPATEWKYKNTSIGTYVDSYEETWTTKVSEKQLYDAVGTAAYDSYTWSIYQNGGLVAADGRNDHTARNKAIAHSKNSSERVLTSGNGVLTQVFVDNDNDTVTLTLIDTGVAKVTSVTGSDGEYDVTVSFRTRVNNGQGATFTPSATFSTDRSFERDDIVIYTASVSANEIITMAVADSVAGKVTAQKDSDYTTLDETQYSYNYAYTKKSGENGVGSPTETGIYDLDAGNANRDPAIDKDVTLYLDAYGYAVAFEGKAATAEDYLFVKEVGEVFNSEPSAKVVFYDGTSATINVDQIIDLNDQSYDAVKRTPASGQKQLLEKTVYKFSNNGDSYDLTVVEAKVRRNNDLGITKKDPSIGTTGWEPTNPGTSAQTTTDNNTVFVDVENNKTWTGYRNVSSKSRANVVSVDRDNSSVAEIVFIYGDQLEGTAEDDDFIVLTGTGRTAVRINGKTVYRLTDAYDIHGEKLTDAYLASNTAITDSGRAGKGLYLIQKRDGNDYITNAVLKFAFSNASGLTGGTGYNFVVDGKNGGGVLTMNAPGDSAVAATGQTTFAYNTDTTAVIIYLKANGDVDRLEKGDASSIVTRADANSDGEITGVYVITVEEKTDTAPMIETLVITVPYSGSTISGGGSGSGSGTSSGDVLKEDIVETFGKGLSVDVKTDADGNSTITVSGEKINAIVSTDQVEDMQEMFGTTNVGEGGEVKPGYGIMTVDVLANVKKAPFYKITQTNPALGLFVGDTNIDQTTKTKTKTYNYGELLDGLSFMLKDESDVTLTVTPVADGTGNVVTGDTIIITVKNSATFVAPAEASTTDGVNNALTDPNTEKVEIAENVEVSTSEDTINKPVTVSAGATLTLGSETTTTVKKPITVEKDATLEVTEGVTIQDTITVSGTMVVNRDVKTSDTGKIVLEKGAVLVVNGDSSELPKIEGEGTVEIASNKMISTGGAPANAAAYLNDLMKKVEVAARDLGTGTKAEDSNVTTYTVKIDAGTAFKGGKIQSYSGTIDLNTLAGYSGGGANAAVSFHKISFTKEQLTENGCNVKIQYTVDGTNYLTLGGTGTDRMFGSTEAGSNVTKETVAQLTGDDDTLDAILPLYTGVKELKIIITPNSASQGGQGGSSQSE